MKGVSEIIAIILILMIVVALAALAYTWFSGMFSTLTTTASNSTTSTSSAMTTNFRIEIAKYSANNNVSVTIRCLGSTPINVSQMSAYISDIPSNIIGSGITTPISYGTILTFNVTNTTLASGSRLRLITATGLEQAITIT